MSHGIAKASILVGSIAAPAILSISGGGEQRQHSPSTVVVMTLAPTTTTLAPTTTTLHFREVLSEGMSGSDVRAMQQRLKDIGYHIVIDGYFGPKTREVVKKFQLEHGLYMDGIVGPQTYEALGIVT